MNPTDTAGILRCREQMWCRPFVRWAALVATQAPADRDGTTRATIDALRAVVDVLTADELEAAAS